MDGIIQRSNPLFSGVEEIGLATSTANGSVLAGGNATKATNMTGGVLVSCYSI